MILDILFYYHIIYNIKYLDCHVMFLSYYIYIYIYQNYEKNIIW